jgi:RNA polymerase sigma factor for flagellar operon FliA
MSLYTASTIYNNTAVIASNSQLPESREELILSHLPKVRFIADRIAAKLPSSVERDDLYGAGIVGLIDAVERYDASRGIAFTTFAEKRVRGAILDNLRSLDWASRSTRRRGRAVKSTFSDLEQEFGRTATDAEVAERLRLPVSEVREILQEIHGLSVLNLDERNELTGLSVADLISDDRVSHFENFENVEDRKRLAAAIDQLPKRERQVIALYYLEELTMKEIGDVMEVTESRVSQIRTQAISRLRLSLRNN